jgi:hypothetical protein
MIKRLFLLSALLCGAALCSSAAVAGQVSAVGAPSENYTVPDSPLTDLLEEIKPAVNYVLAGPTSLTASPIPAFSLDFNGQSQQDKYRVTAAETWYLFVDINAAGWLYIYEDYPAGSLSPGRWLAYKWQIPQRGLWRLGPFSASPGEPEGQHSYRAWYYGEDQWATGPSQGSLVTWTYTRSAPVVTPPATTEPPVRQEAPGEAAMKFITHPAVLLTGPTVLILIIMLAVYLVRRYRIRPHLDIPEAVPIPVEIEEPAEQTATHEPQAIARARLVLPNNSELCIAGEQRIFGRGDLARAIGLDELGLISRSHFRIVQDGGLFFIEDSGSANGTHLNGEDITGKGPHPLQDNDAIELPGAVRIKFHSL